MGGLPRVSRQHADLVNPENKKAVKLGVIERQTNVKVSIPPQLRVCLQWSAYIDG